MNTKFGVLSTILALVGQAAAYSAAPSTQSDPIGSLCASTCNNRPEANTYGYSVLDQANGVCSCITLGRPGQNDITAATGWSPATSKQGACATNDWILWRLDSAWQNNSPQCYTAYTAVEPATLQVPVSDLSTCFERCVTYTMMVLLPTSTNGVFQCQCMSGVNTATGIICGPNTYFAYRRTAAAAASGVYRRSLREAAKREAARKQVKFPFCPDQSQACKITGSAEGYECLETEFELESCGGCVEGVFGARDNSTMTGIDGVPMGAISCVVGKCVAYACDAGWTLKDGRCTEASQPNLGSRPKAR